MSQETSETAVVSCQMQIVNERGLHARAAARFVSVLSDFEADITVEKDGDRVSGRSIMGLMMLAASKGTSIRVEARGMDAELAIAALEKLVRNCFDE